MTYRVRTYDIETGEFTPQEGMSTPWNGLTLWGLRDALHELRRMGYSCHRNRWGSDPSVLVEAETHPQRDLFGGLET